MEIKDINAGESWACKFRTTTFLDLEGVPVTAVNLQLGQAHPGTPGVYESVGIIARRDLDNNLVELVDSRTQKQFVVAVADCWDIDTIDWIE